MCLCGNTKPCSTATSIGPCGENPGQTSITPFIIKPITSSEEASNQYSIEVKIFPRGSASSEVQGNTYTDQAIGDTNAELVASVHNRLVNEVVDIARVFIGDDYTGPGPFVESVHLASLTAFQNYFANTGSVDPDYIPVTDVTKRAYLDFITYAMYSVFLSVEDHIEGAETSLIICGSGSRATRITVENCLFCFTLIYN